MCRVCQLCQCLWIVHSRQLLSVFSNVYCCRLVVFSGYSGFLQQPNWPPRYNRNIVECSVKHHIPNLIILGKIQYKKLHALIRFHLNSYLSLYALLLTLRPCELEVYPFDSLGFFPFSSNCIFNCLLNVGPIQRL